jgi:hypothetical protein
MRIIIGLAPMGTHLDGWMDGGGDERLALLSMWWAFELY